MGKRAKDGVIERRVRKRALIATIIRKRR